MDSERCAGGAVEVRAATGSPGRVVGIIVPAGRVAGDRRELFVGEGITTPADGIRLVPEHRSSKTIMVFDPVRSADGTLRIDHLLPDTPEGREAARVIRDGSKSFLSAEFHSAFGCCHIGRARNTRKSGDCCGTGQRRRVQPNQG